MKRMRRVCTLAPDIPTFAEMGLSALSYSTWLGLFAPNGRPKEIIRSGSMSSRGRGVVGTISQ
jgi:tripartite-type tricarboxylate transporter receptor subunit TctC